jgi:serine O-acetyltransferase
VRLIARVREDLTAARVSDPAARNGVEVALVYSGLHAIWAYRVTTRLWRRPGTRLLARVLAQLTRTLTGVEIHPGARIGRRFFVDHGMGVVIGETAVIGDDVMLYHGVTLGGRSGSKAHRHPTLENGVTVGAVILGPITVGTGSVIGANAVVTKDVPPYSVVTGVPGVARPRRGADGAPHLAEGIGPS